MTTTSSKTAAKPAPKPIGRLDASLLVARKGEAAPSVAATQHNNPGLAWGAPAHPEDFQPQPATHKAAHHASHQAPHQVASLASVGQPVAKARLRPDSFFTAHGRGFSQAHANTSRPHATAAMDRDPVALTMRVEDDTYLRLKYLAQRSGCSTQQVLADALDDHLVHSGVPHSRKLVVKPE